jgi:hypothetical protein
MADTAAPGACLACGRPFLLNSVDADNGGEMPEYRTTRTGRNDSGVKQDLTLDHRHAYLDITEAW